MSLTRNKNGEWSVRWREGGRHRAQIIGTKAQAKAFQEKIVQRKRSGGLSVDDRLTFAEYLTEWWPKLEHGKGRKALRNALTLRDTYIIPNIGGYRMRELRPEVFEGLRDLMLAKGHGPSWIRQAIFLCQRACKDAKRAGYLYDNPVADIQKPGEATARAVRPIPVADVEKMRRYFLGQEHRAPFNRQRDATLLSLLAYAGLRPQEALALRWKDVGEQTIIIDKALSYGAEKDTKTHRNRSVRLLPHLASDLKAWRLASRSFSNIITKQDGSVFSESTYANWRSRDFKAAVDALGYEATRPYDLRHSFVSLLIAEGKLSIVEIADQLGHRREQTLDTYAHVVMEYEGRDISIADEVRQARAAS